jgi:hypothetical protein
MPWKSCNEEDIELKLLPLSLITHMAIFPKKFEKTHSFWNSGKEVTSFEFGFHQFHTEVSFADYFCI